MIYSSPSTSFPLFFFPFLLLPEHDDNNCYLLCAEMELKCVVSNKKYVLCSATLTGKRNAIFKLTFEKYLFKLLFSSVSKGHANISSSIELIRKCFS